MSKRYSKHLVRVVPDEWINTLRRSTFPNSHYKIASFLFRGCFNTNLVLSFCLYRHRKNLFKKT